MTDGPTRAADAGARSRHAALVVFALVAGVFALVVLGAFGVRTGFWPAHLVAFLPAALGRVVVLAAVLGTALATFATRAVPRSAPDTRRAAIAGLLLGLAVLLFPDQSGFLGDFLLRLGALQDHDYVRMFPQGMPLDHWLFGTLFDGLASSAGVVATARVLGLVTFAALLAIAIRGLARVPATRPHVTLGLLLLAGGGLASLFTGFARDTVVFLPLSLAWMFGLGRRVERGTPVDASPEWLLAALLALHRSAVFLLLPHAVATWIAVRHRAEWTARAKAGAVALVVVLAWIVPREIHVWNSFDLIRHAAWLGPAGLAQLPMLDPSHLGNVACALLLLAPASLLVLLLAGRAGDRDARTLDLALVLCWLPLAVLVRPQQGVFRDVDVYAAMALAWAFVGVRALDRLRAGSPALAASLGRLVAATGLVFFAATLLVASDPAATRARVLDALARWPRTPTPTRAQWFDYLAGLAERNGRREEAGEYLLRSADAIPTLLHLARAGVALADAGDYARSTRVFGRILVSDSVSVLGWAGVAGTRAALGDTAGADSAVTRLLGLTGTAAARGVAATLLTRSPAVDPTGRVRAALGIPAPPRP